MTTATSKGILNRAELLLGTEALKRLARKRVILLGVGGVGSWCAESLIRSGIGHLTLVDADRVCLSNCNRQLMATTRTVGQSKVEAMKCRLQEINPEADITALEQVYDPEHADAFDLASYDCIIDAIDTLVCKQHLILTATHLVKQHPHLLFLSSMGAALRMDPTRIRVDEFWKIAGDPLARSLRDRFKRSKCFPASKFLCVYSQEPPLKNQPVATDPAAPGDAHFAGKQPNGSISHITGIFGLTLAGLVIQHCSRPE